MMKITFTPLKLKMKAHGRLKDTCNLIPYTIHTITFRRETMTKEVNSIINIEKYRAIHVVNGTTSGKMYYISQFIKVSLRVRQLVYEVFWLQYELYCCRYKVKSDGYQYSS